MKFDIGVRYKQLSSKREFHENEHSDNHALLKGVSEFLLYLLTDLGDIGNTRDLCSESEQL